MAKQKRYTKEEDILKDIEAYKAKADEKLQHAETLKKQGSELMRSGSYDHRQNGAFMLEQAAMLERAVDRIYDVKLPKLKNCLSAFRTEPFAFSADDKGVVLK